MTAATAAAITSNYSSNNPAFYCGLSSAFVVDAVVVAIVVAVVAAVVQQ